MEERLNKTVSVVVVTCGMNDYINSCLDSLKEQTYPGFEVIVIDNSLNPNFSQEILKRYPFIKLHSNPDNLFYCEPLNKGIKLSKGDFILCLNDDVILDKRFIEEALRGFSAGFNIGMVSGKILRQDRETLDSTGLFLSHWRTVKERGYGLRDRGQFEKAEHIFGVNGAVAFYRKKMLEEIKENGDYFDPTFHIFYEDLDIAWRAQRLGWKAYYIPKATAYHIRGGTVRSNCGIDKSYAFRYLSDGLLTDLIKNRYLTMIKNESFFSFLLRFPCIAIYDIFIWSYVLIFRPKLLKILLSNSKSIKSSLKKRNAFKNRSP